MSLHYLKLIPENERPQIYKGIETIVDRYRSGESGTAVMLPPRFGKSDIIRGSALELTKCGAETSIVVVPWTDLADQIKEESKVRAMYHRYGIPINTRFIMQRCTKMRTSGWWKKHHGTYNLISLTIQLAHVNRIQFLDGLEELVELYGRSVPLFMDECHLIKEKHAWHELAIKSQERGAHLIMSTGTAVPGMPEFNEETDDWREVSYKLHRKKLINGEVKAFEMTYEGEKRDITRIIGHVHVSWGEAWAQKALAFVNAVKIDTKVIDNETNTELGLASELKEDELRGRLKSILESEEFVAKAAKTAVDRLLRRKKGTQALIITGFDYNDGDGSNRKNKHANAFKEAIRRILSNLGIDPDYFKIEIATGTDNDGNPDEYALKKIKDFRLGKIDILIVKMMAIVGLDVPSCKILVFGSPMRKGPLVLQALSRVLTIWNDDRTSADLIMLWDRLMQSIFVRMIHDQGGDVESKVDLINEIEVPLSPETMRDCYTEGAHVAGYADQFGKEEMGDHEMTLQIIKQKYDVGNLTDPQILGNYQIGGFAITQEDRIGFEAQRQESQNAGFKDMQSGDGDKFGDKAKEVVDRHINYGLEPTRWREKLVELQGAAKRHCGVYQKVTEIDDADLIKALIEALSIVEKTVF